MNTGNAQSNICKGQGLHIASTVCEFVKEVK